MKHKHAGQTGRIGMKWIEFSFFWKMNKTIRFEIKVMYLAWKVSGRMKNALGPSEEPVGWWEFMMQFQVTSKRLMTCNNGYLNILPRGRAAITFTRPLRIDDEIIVLDITEIYSIFQFNHPLSPRITPGKHRLRYPISLVSLHQGPLMIPLSVFDTFAGWKRNRSHDRWCFTVLSNSLKFTRKMDWLIQ